jgi:hypothetical protein
MDEHSALEVTAVRAIETQDQARAVWTDADRAWASRTAAEVVGENATSEIFVARRASLVLDRLGERNLALVAAVRGMHWQPWLGWSIVAGAFIFGVLVDRMSGGKQIDLLAPPVLALLVWNMAVYLVLLTSYFPRENKPSATGSFRRMVMRLIGLVPWRRAFQSISQVSGDNVTVAGIATLASTWLALAKNLYAARIGRILHLAAAALALGVIVGLYARGLALEYLATWESTFLDAGTVHVLLAAILAPGAWMSGIPVPDVQHLQAIHAPGNENAAMWVHLFAASVFLIVLVPRIGLASRAGYVEWRLARRFPLPIDEPYFQRLLRGFSASPVRVRVIPFSYSIPEAVRTGLESIMARSFGGSAVLMLDPPMRWDDDGSAVQRMTSSGQGPVIALFNLTATPEKEVHGAFIKALKDRFRAGHALIAVVDESAFQSRWPGDETRIAQRRVVWSELLSAHRMNVIYTNLVAPDLQAVDTAFDASFNSQTDNTMVFS